MGLTELHHVKVEGSDGMGDYVKIFDGPKITSLMYKLEAGDLTGQGITSK